MPKFPTLIYLWMIQKGHKNSTKRYLTGNLRNGVGWFAQCMDTEGNMFGIIEMDEKAE